MPITGGLSAVYGAHYTIEQRVWPADTRNNFVQALGRGILACEVLLGMLRTELGLSDQERIIVWYLLIEGPLGSSDLRQRTCLSASATAMNATKLQRRGLVQRHADPLDGRRSIISITPCLRDQVEQYLFALGDRTSAVSATMPEHRRELLHRFVATLASSFEGAR